MPTARDATGDATPDRTPDATPALPAATGDRTGVPVKEAAARLGLSSEAVRMRLRRGTLAGVRGPDGWRVLLPDDEAHGAPAPDHPTQQPTARTTQRAPGADATPDATATERAPGAVLAELRARLAEAAAERDRWRAAWERESELRAEETAQLRQLLQAEQALAITRLAAIEAEARRAEPQPAPADAPVARPSAPGAAEPARMTRSTGAGLLGALWRRLTGQG